APRRRPARRLRRSRSAGPLRVRLRHGLSRTRPQPRGDPRGGRMSIDLALIGGTGLYRLPGLSNVERRAIDTPYGSTSDSLVVGSLGHRRVAFLARHGESHTIPPHRVNYRANVWALHHIGARRVIGVNAVGGIRDDMGPRVLALPEQIIDYTYERLISFCDVAGAE